VEVPNWYLVQSVVYGVALFSLIVQPPLLPRLSVSASKAGLAA
jgi:hypothetical protein